MTRIIASLAEIGGDYDVLFCDLWGCVHNGERPFPSAVAALQAFRRAGGRVALMTNAPRPQRHVVAQIDRMGVPRDAWDSVVTSGDAAQEALFSGAVGRRVWHVGTDKDSGFFDDVPPPFRDAPPIARVPLSEALGIVVTGPFDEMTETPADYLDRLTEARDRGLPLLCANPDVVVDMGETRIYCAGALAEYYEGLGGTSLYFGKPHPPIYDRARRLLDLGPGARVLVIGDGILTDVKGGLDQGLDVLFVSGGLAAEAMGADVENPERTLLLPWLETHGLAPRFTIGRLR